MKRWEDEPEFLNLENMPGFCSSWSSCPLWLVAPADGLALLPWEVHISAHQCTSVYISAHQCTSVYISAHQSRNKTTTTATTKTNYNNSNIKHENKLNNMSNLSDHVGRLPTLSRTASTMSRWINLQDFPTYRRPSPSCESPVRHL